MNCKIKLSCCRRKLDTACSNGSVLLHCKRPIDDEVHVLNLASDLQHSFGFLSAKYLLHSSIISCIL